jgi:hydroxymethylbilane synthase
MILDCLRGRYPRLSFEVRSFRTRGDRLLAAPLPEIGGKGLFTQELESALLRREIDFAVHSLKDVPGDIPPGLVLRTVGPRADPRDVFVSRTGCPLEELPPGAAIGTSSPRRAAQLRWFRPDLRIKPVRGNLATRLQKMDDEGLDGLVLAAAGILRLDLRHRITEYLSASVCLSAAGQGTLGAECRAEDAETLALLAAVRHRPTELAATAERALLHRLGGNCRIPLAALAVWDESALRLEALVIDAEGRRLARAAVTAAAADEAAATALGEAVAAEIMARGGEAILALAGKD